MASLSVATGLHRLFADALVRDPQLLVLGDDVARLGGSGGVFAGLATAHPEQLRDLPIADRATLAFAVGTALAGRTTLVELTATGRLLASLEVLAEAASVAAAGEFAVPLIVRVPAGGQAGARIDRSVAAALADIDGLTVLCPGTPQALLGAWRAALSARAPTLVLEPRAFLTRRSVDVTTVRDVARAECLRSGEHVTLVSWGSGIETALHAADQLSAEGIQAEVIDLVRLHPLDAATLGESVRRTGRLVVVDAPEGGMSDRVMRSAVDSAFLYLEAPLATAAASTDDVVQAARSSVHY